MKERIRIKDIALRAGVSTGTVDRVIHNRGNVSAETKRKVKEVMEELSYEPNIMASTLAYNRVIRIVVLLPDYRLDPYWDQPRIGIEKALRAVRHYGVGLDVRYFDISDPSDFLRVSRQIWREEKLPDAVLFAPLFLHESQELLTACDEFEVPNVMINTHIDNNSSLCYIGQDSYQSGVLAARLLNFGVSDGDTVFILNLDRSVTNAKHLIDKERGFRDYWEGIHNKKIDIIKLDFEEFNNASELKHFLQLQWRRHPRLSGVFVTNSRAYKVVESLSQAELRSVKIVGYDLIGPNLEHLRDNHINFIINQNPVQQGYLGIINIVNHLVLKKEIDPLQYLPLDIVVLENVDYYLKKEHEMEPVI